MCSTLPVRVCSHTRMHAHTRKDRHSESTENIVLLFSETKKLENLFCTWPRTEDLGFKSSIALSGGEPHLTSLHDAGD
jgi:hypothetical protein